MSAGLYLEKLNLRNFATFENQEIDFHQNFNGIVGETGSGKSLILDAFQLLLGSRADKKLVRKGSQCAVIEGSFKLSNDKIISYFDQIGFPLEEDSIVVIKRIIYATGKSKSYLNHMSCSLSVLSTFSKVFVDLVGQFENQKLSNADYQLQLLDQYSKNQDAFKIYENTYLEYEVLSNEVKSLELQVQDKRKREDYLKFQLNELSTLRPNKEREAQLIQFKNQLVNSEVLGQSLESLKLLSSEGESSILDQLKNARKLSNSLDSFIGQDSLDQLDEVISLFEDFSFGLNSKSLESEVELSLDEIVEELDRYQKLKRKFHCETEQLEQMFEELENELNDIENIESSLKSKKIALVKIEDSLLKLANNLHISREKNKKSLEKKITSALSELNMEGATFQIQLDKVETFNKAGLSRAHFLAETNIGEGFYKIKEIASGGELSRLLLCLRQIVASDDSINIFFFDEIDTGIGGETALKIAQALKKVSANGQVLAITHLPQIAKEVDEIIFVAKKSLRKDKEQRTISYVENKRGKEREEVISTLAGL